MLKFLAVDVTDVRVTQKYDSAGSELILIFVLIWTSLLRTVDTLRCLRTLFMVNISERHHRNYSIMAIMRCTRCRHSNNQCIQRRLELKIGFQQGLPDCLSILPHGRVANSGTDSKEIARILIRFDVEKLRECLCLALSQPGQTNKRST